MSKHDLAIEILKDKYEEAKRRKGWEESSIKKDTENFNREINTKQAFVEGYNTKIVELAKSIKALGGKVE